MRLIAILLALFVGQAAAQVSSSRPLLGDKWTTAPAACAVGQIGFKTNATAGLNLYGCTSANTWTLQGDGSAFTPGTAASASCVASSVLYLDGSKLQVCDGKVTISSTAGGGMTITAGTAASVVSALSLTQTRNYSAGASSYITWAFTETAAHAGDAYFQLLGGAGGATHIFSVTRVSSPGGGPMLQIGTSNGTSIGAYLGSHSSGTSSIWPTSVTPSTTNYAFAMDATNTTFNSVTNTQFGTGGSTRFSTNSTGLAIGNIAAGGGNFKYMIGYAAPTVASGGCTSPGSVTANGTVGFTLASVGTGCSGSQPLVFTLPAAVTGWNCYARNVSNGAISAPAQTGAVSTTSVTISNFVRTTGVVGAWTDADVVVVSCLGY